MTLRKEDMVEEGKTAIQKIWNLVYEYWTHCLPNQQVSKRMKKYLSPEGEKEESLAATTTKASTTREEIASNIQS